MAEALAIFDLEGTLYAGGGRVIWREVIRNRIRGRLITGKIFAHVLLQLLIDLLYRLRLLSRRGARLLGTKEMAALLAGLCEADMEQLVQAITTKLDARLRSDICRILEEHKLQEHRLVLLSGAFQPIVDAIGRDLGIHINIGTKLEKENGCYTGHLSGPICFDEQKASVLKEFIKENHIDVDFIRSYAYGDAISDKPMLELVGNPVAVYPDPELRAHAQRQGWKIIG